MAGPSLTAQQLQEIGAALTGGGRPPRVALRESSSGLPAGSVGTVVRLADPAQTDEFVIVRLGGDELPFTPGELATPPQRARRAKPAAQPKQVARVEPAPEARTEPKPEPPKESRKATAEAAAAPVPKTQAAAKVEPKPAAPRPKPAKAPRRAVARLTVQLHYDERGWTVEASRGARTLVKPTPVRPTAAVRVAELLDNDDVLHVVAEIADTERVEAERKAEELRAQLAEVEAVLAGYQEG